MRVANPFFFGPKIENPHEFFGRKKEFKMIIDGIHNIQSCCVFGRRRFGKSSLLYYIYKNRNEEFGNGFNVAYIDLQDPRFYTVEGFLKFCLKELGCSDLDKINPSNNLAENLIAFSNSIAEMRKNCIPVLLIDEFDELSTKDKFNSDFFKAMRKLGSDRKIAFVTASYYSLKTLCIAGDFTSRFYDIFQEFPLGNFTSEETMEFLSAKRKGVEFNEIEIQFIKKIARNNPLHLQIACYHVFENKTKKWNKKKLRKEIGRDYIYLSSTSPSKIRFIIEQVRGVHTFFKKFLLKIRTVTNEN